MDFSKPVFNYFSFQFSFVAKDAETIARYMDLPKANNVYVIIAQALDEKVPPFILQMYGTTVGSFKSLDVIRRWDFTKEQLGRYFLFKNM